MASYDYRCRTCDGVFEARRSITAQESDVRCPEGHDDVARIWSAVATIGSGAAAGAAPAPSGGGCCGGGCCG